MDIYALGIVFYELARAAACPFRDPYPTEIAVEHSARARCHISANSATSTIPQSVENIILKATAKKVSERYASVEEMREDLLECRQPHMRDVERIQLDDDMITSVQVKDCAASK